jgi:hypothetical protein
LAPAGGHYYTHHNITQHTINYTINFTINFTPSSTPTLIPSSVAFIDCFGSYLLAFSSFFPFFLIFCHQTLTPSHTLLFSALWPSPVALVHTCSPWTVARMTSWAGTARKATGTRLLGFN